MWWKNSRLLRVSGLITVGMIVAILALTGTVYADRPDAQGNHHHGTDDGEVVAGSIVLLTCNDGSVAKWKKSALTYSITDVSGFSAGVLESVEAGVREWNGLGGPYTLGEFSGAGSPDITIELFFKIIPGSIIGAAGINCSTGAAGIQSGSIILGLKGLNDFGIQNVSAHEIGHTLGLGHADTNKDLMGPRFERKEEGKGIVCPSNLDIDGLNASSEPVSVTNLQELAC